MIQFISFNSNKKKITIQSLITHYTCTKASHRDRVLMLVLVYVSIFVIVLLFISIDTWLFFLQTQTNRQMIINTFFKLILTLQKSYTLKQKFMHIGQQQHEATWKGKDSSILALLFFCFNKYFSSDMMSNDHPC